jgi:hypothetical protein
MRILTYLAQIGGASALLLAMATHTYALEASPYLSVSTYTSSLQDLDTSLGLQADLSASATQGMMNASATSSASAGNSNADSNVSGTEKLQVRTGFWDSLQALLGSFGFRLGTSTQAEGNVSADISLADTHVEKVKTTSAVIMLAKPAPRDAVVYYGTSSPVLVAHSTSHASLWRFWKRNEITLRGLVPDTMYYYRIAATVDGSATTTGEASFKTRAK